MRRRSPTNSRKAENLEIREQYREGRFYDELLPYFPAYGLGRVKVPGIATPFVMHGTDAFEIHHGWDGNRGRWDRVWNIVHLCNPVHVWCERYKTDGRVLLLRRKLDCGEWDSADAYECLKFHPLGWVEGARCEHEFAERIRRTIVDAIESGDAT